MAFRCLLNNHILPGLRHPILSQAGLMAAFPGLELDSDQLPGWGIVGKSGGNLSGECVCVCGGVLFLAPIGRKN